MCVALSWGATKEFFFQAIDLCAHAPLQQSAYTKKFHFLSRSGKMKEKGKWIFSFSFLVWTPRIPLVFFSFSRSHFLTNHDFYFSCSSPGLLGLSAERRWVRKRKWSHKKKRCSYFPKKPDEHFFFHFLISLKNLVVSLPPPRKGENSEFRDFLLFFFLLQSAQVKKVSRTSFSLSLFADQRRRKVSRETQFNVNYDQPFFSFVRRRIFFHTQSITLRDFFLFLWLLLWNSSEFPFLFHWTHFCTQSM